MKKTALALALVPALAFAEAKIATVDLLVLVRNHPDYDRNEKFIESKSKDLQKKGDEIKAEGEALQADGKKMMEQFRNPMLNDKAKADLEKKLQDIQQKLLQIEQRYRTEMMRGDQDLRDDRARLMKATTDDLRARLKKFAEAGGYDFILDSNVVPFSKKEYDVTDGVLAEMGVDPRKAKGRGPEDEGK
ncbi:MAG: OmpH family outer membrane protein [Kiritimatiellae bacterium]|nr:OmpH family outer membrane protein [Kiritimatiellia bacterium]